MDKSFRCECGNKSFWYYGEVVRCSNCYNEYMYNRRTKELWLKRFNHEEHRYSLNAEKVLLSFV